MRRIIVAIAKLLFESNVERTKRAILCVFVLPGTEEKKKKKKEKVREG